MSSLLVCIKSITRDTDTYKTYELEFERHRLFRKPKVWSGAMVYSKDRKTYSVCSAFPVRPSDDFLDRVVDLYMGSWGGVSDVRYRDHKSDFINGLAVCYLLACGGCCQHV